MDKKKVFSGRLIRLEEIDSTNEELFRLAAAGARPGLALTAERQSAGRGRSGRSWYSAAGRGIYLSFLLPGDFKIAARSSLVTALAVCEVLEREYRIGAQLKWPNDVLVNGCKLCGVLLESREINGRRVVVAGLGLNTNWRAEDYRSEYRRTPVSLNALLSEPVDHTLLVEKITERCWKLYRRAAVERGWRKLVQRARRRLYGTGKQVIINGKKGCLSGLGPEGELLLTSAAGVELINSGELQFVNWH